MNKNRAEAYLNWLLGSEKIADLYDDDDMLQEALITLCPGFEYPDHSYRTIGEFLNKYGKETNHEHR